MYKLKRSIVSHPGIILHPTASEKLFDLHRLFFENIKAKSKFVAKLFCSFFGVWDIGLAGNCSLNDLLRKKGKIV